MLAPSRLCLQRCEQGFVLEASHVTLLSWARTFGRLLLRHRQAAILRQRLCPRGGGGGEGVSMQRTSDHVMLVPVGYVCKECGQGLIWDHTCGDVQL